MGHQMGTHILHYTLKKEHQKYEKCKIEDNIRNWRNAADKMTPQDRDAICKLLKNNNTPIPSSDFLYLISIQFTILNMCISQKILMELKWLN